MNLRLLSLVELLRIHHFVRFRLLTSSRLISVSFWVSAITFVAAKQMCDFDGAFEVLDVSTAVRCDELVYLRSSRERFYAREGYYDSCKDRQPMCSEALNGHK